jgi:hypothetical protein
MAKVLVQQYLSMLMAALRVQGLLLTQLYSE